MREHELARPASNHASAKRIGRGHGSGRGTTAGKGTKGQKARSGVHIRPGFEGGQLPIIKRLPELRGFRNPFRVEYQVVNVESLEHFHVGAKVTPEMLHAAGLVKDLGRPVKILGTGNLNKAVHVSAHGFSNSAKEKIVAAGGTAENLNARPDSETAK